MGAHACFGASFERLSRPVVSVDEGSPGPLLRLRNGLLAVIAPATDPARSLIAGVVCGRSSELRAQPAGDWFSVTGTAHLIAVSGSHFAIVGFVIEGVLQKTRCSRGLQRAILAITLVGYAVFTGASPSAVRACCMVFGDACRKRRGASPAWPLGTICDHVHLCAAAADGTVRDGFSAFMRQRLSHSVLLPLCDLRFGRAGHAIGCCQHVFCHAVLATGDTSRYHSCIWYVFAHCSACKCRDRSGDKRTACRVGRAGSLFARGTCCGLGRSLCP